MNIIVRDKAKRNGDIVVILRFKGIKSFLISAHGLRLFVLWLRLTPLRWVR